MVEGRKRHSRRWDGSRKDYPDHLIPVSAPPRAKDLAVLDCCATFYSAELEARNTALESKHEGGFVPWIGKIERINCNSLNSLILEYTILIVMRLASPWIVSPTHQRLEMPCRCHILYHTHRRRTVTKINSLGSIDCGWRPKAEKWQQSTLQSFVLIQD